MAVIIIHLQPDPDNAQNTQVNTIVDGCPIELALQVLPVAAQLLQQRLAGPKLIMPNGQAHVVPPHVVPPHDSTPPPAPPTPIV